MKMKCHLLAAGVWLIRFLTHTTKAMSQTAGVFVFPFCGGTLALYEAPTNFVVSVERVGGSEGTVTVDCATSNLTATARLDYVAHSGSLTFGPGETSKPFFIPILPDSLVEPKETLLVTLSSPTGGAGL